MTERSQSFVMIGQLHDLGRPEQAIAAAREAVMANPDDATALCYLSMVLVGTDPKAALAAAEHALKIAPDYQWAKQMRVSALLATRRSFKEVDQLRALIAENPSDLWSRLTLAEILVTEGGPTQRRAGARKAQPLVDEAKRLSPNNAAVYFVQARIDIEQNNLKQAEHAARRGLQIRPNAQLGHELLGMAAKRQGRTRAAGEHFLDAAKLDPQGSTSTTQLRQLHRADPDGKLMPFLVPVVLYGGLSYVTEDSSTSQLLLNLVAALAFIAIVGRQVLRQVQAESLISDEARTALDRDRELRPHFWNRRG